MRFKKPLCSTSLANSSSNTADFLRATLCLLFGWWLSLPTIPDGCTGVVVGGGVGGGVVGGGGVVAAAAAAVGVVEGGA